MMFFKSKVKMKYKRYRVNKLDKIKNSLSFLHHKPGGFGMWVSFHDRYNFDYIERHLNNFFKPEDEQ